MRHFLCGIVLAGVFCVSTHAGAEKVTSTFSEAILPPTVPLVGTRTFQQWRDTNTAAPTTLPTQIPRNQMLLQYTLNLADEAWARWQNAYEQRTKPEDILAHQRELREKFFESIGGRPPRTPLNPRIVGRIQREGYSVEKIIFESQPKHYVTAALFLPDAKRFKPPYPGVIVPCGHAKPAKEWEAYQSMGALLALNGMAGLVFDPIEQGERLQFPETRLWGTAAHDLIGIGSILLGRSTATFEIWDGMRAIDYLQSRADIDPKRVGCTGNSGGGTQTSYLMSLDERIVAAAPSCYVSRMGSQIRGAYGDAEQQIFGQLAWGMDHPNYLFMNAPQQRVIILAATKDFFDINATWWSFRYAKRMYTRLGFPERIDILENDAEHNYGKLQREGAVRWMSRWLLGRDEAIVEPTIDLTAEKELCCAPDGNVMKIGGARSTYDLNEELERTLAERRKMLWKDADRARLLEQVRRLAGIRRLSELPSPKVSTIGKAQRQGYRVEKLIIEPETGIYLPAILLEPAKREGAPVLYVRGLGMACNAESDATAQKWIEAGRVVLAVDLRGSGETDGGDGWAQGSTNYRAAYTAYLLGRSVVGLWAEDVLICSRYLRGRYGADRAIGVELRSVGVPGVAALHAAALEPGLFAAVKVEGTIASWSELVRQRPPSLASLPLVVHGALACYDLPDLAALIAKAAR